MQQDVPQKNSGEMKNMPGMESAGSMNMGPLLVMAGDEIAIRVGSSDTNVMSMGAMGSGTSWQPSAGPMYMNYWNKRDWLLMFHYNIVTGVNSQGGPRGVTKFESANWFMPMAYHKLGKGTLQGVPFDFLESPQVCHPERSEAPAERSRGTLRFCLQQEIAMTTSY